MRERAQQCRAQAVATMHRESRIALLELAAKWEALAKRRDEEQAKLSNPRATQRE
jgi:hypothetical protein